MARLESIALGSYYPAPKDLIERFAALVELPRPEMKGRWNSDQDGRYVIFDPVAGDGAAVLGLCRAWTEGGWDHLKYDQGPYVITCEMEEKRAAKINSWTNFGGQIKTALHGDAFSLTWPETSPGASILYLNSPYGHDPQYKRLEERFLARFTEALAPGGALLYLLPVTSLAASAETLAKHYRDHHCWRLPEPFYSENFKQAILVARRRKMPCPSIDAQRETEEMIRGWSDPAHLWELPESCKDPLVIEPAKNARTYRLSLTLMQADLRATVQSWRPPGEDTALDDLIGRQYVTAMPPRPAHLALAVASGIFNGKRLEPNDRFNYPPILLKGQFTRDEVEVDAKHDKKGNKTGSVQVEQPKLVLYALRLDTYRIFEPPPGVAPTGETDLEKMNTADLLEHYSGSLAETMAQQFPSLHNPADPNHQFKLPETGRPPFECQRHAIQASLKVLSRGENVWAVAEVGTGKTQVALAIALALRNHLDTNAELQRIGFKGRPLTHVKRVLVLCPPHLVGSWIDQAQAIVPEWKALEVTGISDLEREADLYILSREKAKLGPAIEGVSKGCPRCGASLPAEPKVCGAKRLSCEAMPTRPANGYAIDLERLALAVRAEIPQDEVVRAVCARYKRIAPDARAVDTPAAEDVLSGLLARVEGFLGETEYSGGRLQALHAIRHLAWYLGKAEETAALLSDLGTEDPHRYSTGPHDVKEASREILQKGRFSWSEPEIPESGRSGDLVSALEYLYRLAEFTQGEPCGEPLYYATSPRRVPLATQIVRRYRDRFDFFILDEAHEFNSKGSAQAKAAHRLLGLGKPSLLLSGSFMGGYSSSLFANMWASNRRFRKIFDRDDTTRFIDRFGYRKTLYTPSKGVRRDSIDYGKQSDREMRCNAKRLGEAPGIMPPFLMQHLLPVAVMMHKADLETELPDMDELQHSIYPDSDVTDGGQTQQDREILTEYRRLESLLLQRIKADMFSPLSGKLLGQLLELPSYLDRCTDDQTVFRLAYPKDCDGEVIAVGRQFPASIQTPKERWLISRLREALAANDRTLIFCRHTGTDFLPNRLLRLIRGEVDDSAQWLDAKKVGARKREAWITKNVNEPECKVLIVNPRAIQTGLNNLVTFNRCIWHEGEYSAFVVRQAAGRIHRIGQGKHCTVDWPFYSGTAQEVAKDLVAAKVSASLQVDGLSITGALEACGLDPTLQAAQASIMSIGKAIYEALMRRSL